VNSGIFINYFLISKKLVGIKQTKQWVTSNKTRITKEVEQNFM
jgi:hypothetical protein